jgi:hypothetical protein
MSPVEFLQGETLSRRQRVLLLLLLILAAASTSVGVRNAIHRSQDFQWSGERVLLGHVDPWAEYLRSDPGHRFILSQVPNYLAILYVLIAPVGMLPMPWANGTWAACNVIFACVSALMASRFYGSTGSKTAGVVCLMLIATPTRTAIGNGQMGLLVLMVWCMSLFSPVTSMRSAVSGISYLKFSFAPPLALYLMFRSGVRAVIWSMVPMAGSLVLVWLWVTGGHGGIGLVRMAFEPFRVAVHGFVGDPGDTNLMSLLGLAMTGHSAFAATAIAHVVPLALCCGLGYLVFRRHRKQSLQWQMAMLATMSFALFEHHSYDGVVLLLPACFALGRWREWQGRGVLLLLFYLLYGQRLVEAAHLQPAWAAVPEFAMLVLVLGLTFQMRSRAPGADEARTQSGVADGAELAQEAA